MDLYSISTKKDNYGRADYKDLSKYKNIKNYGKADYKDLSKYKNIKRKDKHGKIMEEQTIKIFRSIKILKERT